jgi:hypothetical protein
MRIRQNLTLVLCHLGNGRGKKGRGFAAVTYLSLFLISKLRSPSSYRKFRT